MTTLEDLGARLRADMAELTSLRAALDCAVPQYPGDALQQLGYLIALAQPERRAPATTETVRPPPTPAPEPESDVPICADCVHTDVYHGDYPCNSCRGLSENAPSYWEPKP